MEGKKNNLKPWDRLRKNAGLEEPTPVLNQVYLGMHTTRMPNDQKDRGGKQKLIESLLSAGTVKP